MNKKKKDNLGGIPLSPGESMDLYSHYVAQMALGDASPIDVDRIRASGRGRPRAAGGMPYVFTVGDIRRMHPKSLPPSPTDREYSLLANRMERALLESGLDELASPGAMKAIVGRVVMYFEDIVADAGMWRAFVTKSRELYGRPYPFYSVDGDEPFADEPDMGAVRLLVWDAFRDFRGPGRVINPENPLLTMAARILFGIIDAEFENVAINEQLADYFREARFADDFYEMRDVLKWIFFDCYLTSDSRAWGIVEESMRELAPFTTGQEAYYAAECAVPMLTQVGMLALLPKDWLSLFVGAVGSKRVADRIAGVEVTGMVEVLRKTGFDKDTVSLVDTDGRQIVLRRDDCRGMSDKDLERGEGAIGCYAKYDGHWYLNGNHAWGKLGAVFDETRRIRQSDKGLSEREYSHLMELTGRSPLFYFKDIGQVVKFLKEEMGGSRIVNAPEGRPDATNIAMFALGPGEPLAFVVGGAQCICDPRNPYYDRKNARNDALGVVVDGRQTPGVVARYLIAHGMLPDAGINSARGDEYGRRLLQDNIDFFARAYRREDY